MRKQTPIPDEDSQIFWEGCRRHRLLIQQCDGCGSFRFPPAPMCSVCWDTAATWQEDPGNGEILTYCVYHAELAGPPWRDDLPYIVVVVRLGYSGVQILSNLVGSDPQTVRIGLPVCLSFVNDGAETPLPRFYVCDDTARCGP